MRRLLNNNRAKKEKQNEKNNQKKKINKLTKEQIIIKNFNCHHSSATIPHHETYRRKQNPWYAARTNKALFYL